MVRYFLYNITARVLIRHSLHSAAEADKQREEYIRLTGGNDIRILKIIDPTFTHEDVARMVGEYNIYGDRAGSEFLGTGDEEVVDNWKYKSGKVVAYTHGDSNQEQEASHAQKSGTKA